MIQVTLSRNDLAGYTVFYIYEHQEMNYWQFDDYDEAVLKLKELLQLI
jgi:hypothetical protein